MIFLIQVIPENKQIHPKHSQKTTDINNRRKDFTD